MTSPVPPDASRVLTITHTPTDGTLLEGSSKGDGAWEAIKAAQDRYEIRGWKYFPSIRAIGVRNSRDHAPNLGNIDRTAEILREAGFEVVVDIDGAPRKFEEQEADRADRMDDRATALHAKADRKAGEAEHRYQAAREIGDNIPMGQPVLVGHHSERGHRRDLARMDGHMRASVEADREATTAADRAAAAERHMDARNNPRRVYRRIRKLEADLRRAQRYLDGYTTRHLDGQGNPVYVFEHGPAEGRGKEQHELEVAHLTEQLRGWREALDAAKSAGVWVPTELADVSKGDWIKSWAGWKQVVRVNKVSVTVEDSCGEGRPTFTRTIKIDEIREHRTNSPFEPTPAEVAIDLDAATADVEPAEPVPVAVVPAPPARHPSGMTVAALELLRAAGATETTVHIAGVPESRDVFAEADKWLRRVPGFAHYDTRQRAYVYTRDPRPALQEVTGIAPVRPASGEQDRALSYFRTPDMTARMMATELGVMPGGRVLEPSAGDGALVLAVLIFHPQVSVDAVEVDQARAQLLRNRFGRSAPQDVTVHEMRFQDYAATPPAPYDAVVMNPPFTESGDRQAWATHFLAAWELLAPGGRMVAVLPMSYRSADTKPARRVRDLVEGNSGVVVDLPESTFAGVGTNVHTVLVSVTRQAEAVALARRMANVDPIHKVHDGLVTS